MTRNLIAKATRTQWAAGSNKAGRRCRRGASPCLENLEGRLSMSGIVGNHIPASSARPRRLTMGQSMIGYERPAEWWDCAIQGRIISASHCPSQEILSSPWLVVDCDALEAGLLLFDDTDISPFRSLVLAKKIFR